MCISGKGKTIPPILILCGIPTYFGKVGNCKTVNLVYTLGWSRGVLSVNGRSHVIRHVLTLRMFGAPKKLRFWRNCKEMFNGLNSTNWVELHKGQVQGVTGWVHVQGWDHVQGSRAGGIWVAWSDLHLRMGGVLTVQTLQVKRRCQLVVKLKANKCYQELLRSLSSYINLLNIRLLLGSLVFA